MPFVGTPNLISNISPILRRMCDYGPAIITEKIRLKSRLRPNVRSLVGGSKIGIYYGLF